jgi:hypothetical protein
MRMVMRVEEQPHTSTEAQEENTREKQLTTGKTYAAAQHKEILECA